MSADISQQQIVGLHSWHRIEKQSPSLTEEKKTHGHLTVMRVAICIRNWQIIMSFARIAHSLVYA